MKILSNLKELMNKRILFSEIVLLILSFILICPYFILSYFNNPSVDDYSFALKSFELGYWEAQVSAYMTWNGRFFASFILSANPLYLGSLMLYKVIPVVLLALTIHSFYYFIRNCFKMLNIIPSIILATVIAFLFLNKMPILVQGIYWAPGAITYQLANIMTLYLMTNIIRIVSNPDHNLKSLKIISGFLAFAICGSNETSMLAIDLILMSFLFYYLAAEKRINSSILMLFLFAIAGTCVVLLTPANAIRDAQYVFPNEKNLSFTIISSFQEGFTRMMQWAFSKQITVVSLLAILFYFIWGQKIVPNKKNIFTFLFIVLCGYLIITATFSTGFWSTGKVAPDRTINVSYWLFIILWFTSVFIATSLLTPLHSYLKTVNFNLYVSLCFVALVLTVKPAGNYFNACKDLISGKAFVYNKESKKRIEIVQNCDKSAICEVPSFSMYPTSIFNEDITDDVTNWWNKEYAKFYEVQGVKVIIKEPYYTSKYLLNFDTEEHKTLKNGNSITNEVFFSAPNSSLQNGPDSYSVIFERSMRDLDMDSPKEITTINLSAQIYTTDSTINSVFVICIVDPTNDHPILWLGKDLLKSEYPSNKWVKESFNIPITERSALNPSYKITSYLWNRGKGKVYMDDFLITIY